jgi:hypothetical protein
MTTMYQETVKCYVCGKESKQTVLGSTNSFGSQDLDLRPPEMMRGTMEYWAHECPYCGYIAKNIDLGTVVTEAWLAGVEFINANNIEFESELAKRCYKEYLINLEDENKYKAFAVILYAAWACDDAQDIENAVLCRNLALDLIDELIEKEDDPSTLMLQKIDLLRRSNQFNKALGEFSGIFMDKDLLQDILDFQLEKVKNHDNACYTIEDVKKSIV